MRSQVIKTDEYSYEIYMKKPQNKPTDKQKTMKQNWTIKTSLLDIQMFNNSFLKQQSYEMIKFI